LRRAFANGELHQEGRVVGDYRKDYSKIRDKHSREILQDIEKSSPSQGLIQLARQVSACTRFHATTAAVHTLEKQTGVMERGKRSTEKKWNPSATEH